MGSNTQTAAETRASASQVLTFTLGGETYGVDILRVQEIRGWSPVTRIPHSPSQVLGVLNLRGSIVPIVDLRMQFNLERAGYTAATVIIVLAVHSAAARREFGVVVDGVSDVVNIDAADVKDAPEIGGGADAFITGLVGLGERMLILLDIDKLIGCLAVDTTPLPLAANG